MRIINTLIESASNAYNIRRLESFNAEFPVISLVINVKAAEIIEISLVSISNKTGTEKAPFKSDEAEQRLSKI